MAVPQTDRRRHPRVAAPDLPLRLGVDGKDALRIRDLSQSGISFYAEEPVSVMTRVQFAIEFPQTGAEAVLAQGEGVVVRCERVSAALSHYEVAVFFSDLDARGTKLVTQWVGHRLEEADAT